MPCSILQPRNTHLIKLGIPEKTFIRELLKDILMESGINLVNLTNVKASFWIMKNFDRELFNTNFAVLLITLMFPFFIIGCALDLINGFLGFPFKHHMWSFDIFLTPYFLYSCLILLIVRLGILILCIKKVRLFRDELLLERKILFAILGFVLLYFYMVLFRFK